MSKDACAFVCAILFVCFLSVFALTQQESPVLWGPVLGAVGNDFIAITWNTSRPVGADLRYATAADYESKGTWDDTLSFGPHAGIAEIRLGDLSPGTAYRYQLVVYEGDAVYKSPVGRFTTAGGKVARFSFLVYGGTSTFPDRHKFVAEHMADDEPNAAFVVNVGELVQPPSRERLRNFFWAAGTLARDHPYLVVPDARYGKDSLYYAAFPLPAGGGEANEEWWSFDYGNVHLIGLDSNVSTATLSAETEWLRRDLARSDAPFKLVFTYRPIYSSSLPGGVNETLRARWEPIFKEYGVRVVISGAVHCYEHLYLNGIHYLVTGGGGAPLQGPPSAIAGGTVFQRYGMLHYLRITVTDGLLQVETIPVASVYDNEVHLTPDNRPIDSFTLTKPQ